mmetsp:Transcript_26977/g.55195  ORF Transcript_26977/g.55195 Transcript_26977/m.55195 type:complete len:210 (+) Transcript_26977:1216-1845(+)
MERFDAPRPTHDGVERTDTSSLLWALREPTTCESIPASTGLMANSCSSSWHCATSSTTVAVRAALAACFAATASSKRVKAASLKLVELPPAVPPAATHSASKSLSSSLHKIASVSRCATSFAIWDSILESKFAVTVSKCTSCSVSAKFDTLVPSSSFSRSGFDSPKRCADSAALFLFSSIDWTKVSRTASSSVTFSSNNRWTSWSKTVI